MGTGLLAGQDLRTITAGDAAKCLDCSRSKVHLLFDRGVLKGHQDPDSRYRRIFLWSVIEQMDRARVPRERLELIK